MPRAHGGGIMKAEYRMMVLFVLAGVVLWVADAWMDYLYVPVESFWHVLAADVILIVCFVAFGLLMAKVLYRERQAADLLRAFRDNIPDPVYVKDREHRFTIVSQAKADHWQTTVEDMIGKTDHDFFTEAEADAAQADEQRVMETGEPIAGKTERITHPDGSKHWYSISKVPHRDAAGQIIGVLGISRDITELKQAEGDLRERVKELNCLYSISEIIESSPGADLGELLQEIVNVLPPSWQYPDIACARIVMAEREYDSHSPTDCPTQWRQSADISVHGVVSGTVCVCYAEERPFLREECDLIRAIAERLGRIIEWKQSETALHESEHRFRRIVDNAPFGYYRVSKDGLWEDVNPAWLQMHGYSREDVIGKHFSIRQPDDEQEQAAESVRRVLSGKSMVGESGRLTKEGEIRYHSFNIQPIYDGEEITAIEGFINDITERKRADATLRMSLRLLQVANTHIEMSPWLRECVVEIKELTGCEAVGIRMLDEQGNIPYQAYEGFSWEFYERESPLSTKSDQCMCINVIKGTTDPALPFYTENGSFYMNGTSRFLATVSEEEKEQTRNVCHEFGYESVGLIPISGRQGILGLIHVADSRENMVPLYLVELMEGVAMQLAVTVGRIRAETELVEERNRLDITLRSIGDGVIATDGEGRVVLINDVAEELTGWLESEALGRPVSEIFMVANLQTREPVADPVERVLASGGLVGLARDTVLVGRDGTERIITESGAAIRTDDEITGVVLVFRDVTERTRWEEARRENQKMAAVGTLAMGVAHDFNNLLQALMGRAQLMLHSRDFDAETTEDLSEMVRAGERGASLVRRLLTFSRQVEPAKQVVQLGRPIDDVRAILERTISKLVEINARVSDDLWPVEADPHHIEQVLLNLSINASEAMPQGGTLELSAENVALEEPNEGIPAGRYVLVTVSDTGIGMAKNALERIFEPFYTAKGRAEHSGLGLAVVHGIIKSHGGFIRIDSEPDAGTTFRIYLLAAGAEAEGVSAANVRGEEVLVLRRPATVLVVDDEPGVAHLACDILEHGGHHFLKALDGEEAVELFSTDHERIDLVVLDLVMPKMDGEQCLGHLREIVPDVPVIITTGYIIDSTTRQRLAPQVHSIVEKPFTVEGLLNAVNQALPTK